MLKRTKCAGNKAVLVSVIVADILAALTTYWDQNQLSPASVSDHFALFDVNAPIIEIGSLHSPSIDKYIIIHIKITK